MRRAGWRRFLALFLAVWLNVLMVPLSAQAVVAVDGTSSSQASSAASLTWSHSNTAGTTLVVGISWRAPDLTTTVSSVTYAGVALTQVPTCTAAAASTRQMDMWYVASPTLATGANNIVVTMSSTATSMVAGAVTLTGGSTTTPLGTCATATGGGTSASVTATSSADSMVVAVMVASTGSAATPSASQTDQWNAATASMVAAGATATGAATVTPSWSFSTSLNWAMGAVSVVLAGTVPPPPPPPPQGAGDPLYPTAFVTTTLSSAIPAFSQSAGTVNGSTFTVNAGGNVQAAINSAAAANGDLTHQVVVEAGATFSFPSTLNLPVKAAGSGWIIIRTSNLAGLSSEGQRVTSASNASAMPKFQLSGSPYGLETTPGANHYRFIGIEFIRTGGASNGVALNLWNQALTTLASIPTDIVIDRCILRRTVDTNKLLALQAIRGAVVDSELVNATVNLGDANAIWMFNSPGPMKILNNLILGAGETVFFGAATYVNPYDIHDVELRRNRIGQDPTWTGNAGKNIIEWKGGSRIWIAGNIIEEDLGVGQALSVTSTPRPLSEGWPTTRVDDIIIEYNVLRRTKALFGFSGREGTSNASKRLAVRHNYATEVNRMNAGALWLSNGTDQLTFDHNTIVNTGTGLRFLGGAQETLLTIKNSIFSAGTYAVEGAGTGFGTAALDAHAPTRVFSKNVLVGPWPTPGGVTTSFFTGNDASLNFFPQSVTLNADGSLPAGSPYKNGATDGMDIGPDFTTLYGTNSGVGRFGTGANDYYAYTGQWPSSSSAPVISSLNPSTAAAGDAAFTLTVTGFNFSSSSTVQVGGSDRTTTFVSSTSLTAAIPATDVASAGTLNITVSDPTNGTSNTMTLTVSTSRSAPVLSSIAPTHVLVGSAQFVMTATGSSFHATSVVRVSGTDVPTAFVNTTRLDATITSSWAATAGDRHVTVFTGPPGGGESSHQTLGISNPVPVLTSSSPSSATAGAGPLTLTLTGTHLVSTTQATWHAGARATTYVNATTLTTTILASDLHVNGLFHLAAVSAAPGGGTSNIISFTVNNPLPVVASFSPLTAAAGGAAFALQVAGSGFNPDSNVRWNGSDLITTYLSANHLSALVGATHIATAGPAAVTVFNDTPGGGTSNTSNFHILSTLSAPTLSSISPTSATAGSGQFILTATGLNFHASSVVTFNDQHRATVFGSSTTLTATILSGDISGAGTPAVRVWTPPPGGGVSASQTFTINAPSPTSGINVSTSFLSWTAISGADSYKIKCGTSPGVYTVVTQVYAPNTRVFLRDFLPTTGGTYYCTLVAVNKYGDSGNSPEVSLTIDTSTLVPSTPAAAPTLQ